MAATEQPRRKDAARNRLLLLETARRVFAERGLGVTLHSIAAEAGVGVGTIYRHFPDKKLLIDAVSEAQVDDYRPPRAALADPDPWAGIVWFHEKSLDSRRTTADSRS